MQCGDAEAAVDQAVTVLAHREPGAFAGAAFLVLEQAAFVLLGDLGCDHVQHVAAEDLQRLRVVVGGLGQQPLLGGVGQGGDVEPALLGHLGRDLLDGFDCVEDDPRLLDHQPALTQRADAVAGR